MSLEAFDTVTNKNVTKEVYPYGKNHCSIANELEAS